ncbi:hypothetical protein H2200_003614 [Cladophialophora chaetospira]|uniref:Uncharacterized protein n=1 Tax=Cladophialophora chaetospira TaxID=386627 RepID=A0AA39CK54_9EURO|nr:hypothetical protein H2200_003614 [Cladophialophora chaetospira]
MKIGDPTYRGTEVHLPVEVLSLITVHLATSNNAETQSLHAPAITFSVAALAPLSKCPNLRLLDLSGDQYSIQLSELLNSIRGLEHLTSLGLPKNILCDHGSFPPVLHWPPNLERLRAPGTICSLPQSWDTLFRSWPRALKDVQFPDGDFLQDCPFARFEDCREKATFIERLVIGFTPRHPARPVMTGTLFDILHVFSCLKEVTVPDILARNALLGRYNPAIEEVACNHSTLEILVVTSHAAGQLPFGFQVDVQPQAELCLTTLPRLLKLPKLRRLVISGSFVSRDTEEKENVLKMLSDILERRANPELRGSSGIFVLEDL